MPMPTSCSSHTRTGLAGDIKFDYLLAPLGARDRPPEQGELHL